MTKEITAKDLQKVARAYREIAKLEHGIYTMKYDCDGEVYDGLVKAAELLRNFVDLYK